MITAWGYEVSETVEPIISVSEFNEMTNNVYASNPRVASALKAASQSIRNFCGWHISPSMTCAAYPIISGKLAKLPANYVSAVTSVYENDEELTTGYEWRHDGLLRRTQFRAWSKSWDAVRVTYTAGYDAVAVPDLVEAVCAIASGVLAVSPGVVSESADGVSISYSANASSIAAALTVQQKNALAPYILVSSHAA